VSLPYNFFYDILICFFSIALILLCCIDYVCSLVKHSVLLLLVVLVVRVLVVNGTSCSTGTV